MTSLSDTCRKIESLLPEARDNLILVGPSALTSKLYLGWLQTLVELGKHQWEYSTPAEMDWRFRGLVEKVEEVEELANE